jgi:hypothetical protein
MAEHLTENQKKRVRFSPSTIKDVWQNGYCDTLEKCYHKGIEGSNPSTSLYLRGGMVDAEDLKSSIE